MRVVLLSPQVFRHGAIVGGGERYAFELARALSELVPTRLVTVGDRRDRRTVQGVAVETFAGRGGLCGDVTNPPSPEFLRGLAGSEVVHCLGHHKLMVDSAILWSRFTGRRVFCTDVGGGGPCLSTYAGRLGLPDSGRLAHGHVALSEFAARYCRSSFAQSRVVFGGVDELRYTPGGEPKERRVLFVGRLLPHKGVDRLIRCLPAEVPLTLAGRPYDGEYLEYLHRLADGKSVDFAYNVGDDQLVQLYRQAAVVVLPSVYTDYRGAFHPVPELLGLTLVEAMACATPVVCTRVGAMPEVVRQGETGFVVPEGDGAALRDAVLALLDDRVRAAAMGAAAREQVTTEFTWRRTAERCLQAYEELG